MRGAWPLIMTKQRKQVTRQVVRTDEVFKVKNKSSKKQSKSKVMKAKSVSETYDVIYAVCMMVA